MPFTDALKKQVREKAAFRCCICRQIGVGIEVHHIIPESEGGPDTLDNAAPLCPTCHTELGDNPKKRERIREMRDWLYRDTEKRYEVHPYQKEFLQSIDKKVESIAKRQENGMSQLKERQENDMIELKAMLKRFASAYIDRITPDTAISSSSLIVTASSGFASSEEIDRFFKKCNE